MALQVLSFSILYGETPCGGKDLFWDLSRWKPSLWKHMFSFYNIRVLIKVLNNASWFRDKEIPKYSHATRCSLCLWRKIVSWNDLFLIWVTGKLSLYCIITCWVNNWWISQILRTECMFVSLNPGYVKCAVFHCRILVRGSFISISKPHPLLALWDKNLPTEASPGHPSAVSRENPFWQGPALRSCPSWPCSSLTCSHLSWSTGFNYLCH